MEHRGLDTLAALCGGARKAYADHAVNDGAAVTSNQPSPSTQSMPPVEAKVTPPAAPQGQSQSSGQSTVASHETQQFPISKMADPSMQPWQALATAAAFGSFQNPATFASMIQAAAQNQCAIQHQAVDPNSYMQQFAYYQYMAAIQAQQMTAQNSNQKYSQAQSHPNCPGPQPSFSVDTNAVKSYGYSSHQAASQQVVTDASPMNANQPLLQVKQAPVSQPLAFCSNQQVIPGPQVAALKPAAASSHGAMQPPLPPTQTPAVSNTLSTNAMVVLVPPVVPSTTALSPSKIAPVQSTIEAPIAQRPMQATSSMMQPPDGKKQLKRAANRRSAQLSRKRKKLYIEELKEENDELRRKEQILMSIPDLIVVFDSAGKLWFVSQSVDRFLDFLPEELEGSSFWNRLCEESVRLLKAAFMDALAARNNDMDTAPLGSGVWELRLLDKDGSHKVVTLNGVVHFSGEAPECVCSIRPRDNKAVLQQVPVAAGQAVATDVTHTSIRAVIKPSQSVIAKNGSETDDSDTQAKVAQRTAAENGRLISDAESVVSESGSE